MNSPLTKLASRRNELLRLELPAVDIRIPRVPRNDRRHALPKIRWNGFRHDERLLPAHLVGIAELETEDAEDVAGDVPGGLRVPAVRDFHDDAESIRIFGMLDGQPQQTIGAFFGQDSAVTRF